MWHHACLTCLAPPPSRGHKSSCPHTRLSFDTHKHKYSFKFRACETRTYTCMRAHTHTHAPSHYLSKNTPKHTPHPTHWQTHHVSKSPEVFFPAQPSRFASCPRFSERPGLSQAALCLLVQTALLCKLCLGADVWKQSLSADVSSHFCQSCWKGFKVTCVYFLHTFLRFSPEKFTCGS